MIYSISIRRTVFFVKGNYSTFISFWLDIFAQNRLFDGGGFCELLMGENYGQIVFSGGVQSTTFTTSISLSTCPNTSACLGVSSQSCARTKRICFLQLRKRDGLALLILYHFSPHSCKKFSCRPACMYGRVKHYLFIDARGSGGC